MPTDKDPAGWALHLPVLQLIVGPDAATMTILAAALVAVMASVPAGLALDRTAVAAILAIGSDYAAWWRGCFGSAFLRPSCPVLF
jgi:hypothetical protein